MSSAANQLISSQEENPDSSSHDNSEDPLDDDTGAECVICFTDTRDTVLLPCRHFCVCNSCARNLRYRASNCPICRARESNLASPYLHAPTTTHTHK